MMLDEVKGEGHGKNEEECKKTECRLKWKCGRLLKT